MLTDHLGSTVALTAADGSLLSQQRYLPFGGTREMPGAPLLDHTDLTYTGQPVPVNLRGAAWKSWG
jgi:hypothetical protein